MSYNLQNKKASIKEAFLIQSRGGRIRTCGPLLPKQDGLIYNYLSNSSSINFNVESSKASLLYLSISLICID